VVGAPVVNSGAGAVYVFERNNATLNNWGQRIKKFAEPMSFAGDEYGISVAIDGEYIVVGASGTNSSDGAAYILRKDSGGANNWGTITTTYGDVNSGHGGSVSINSRYAVVGSNNSSGALGKVDVYYNTDAGDTWEYTTELKASDGNLGDAFGNTVGISGSNIVVGALTKFTAGVNTGGAYMFSVGGRRLNSSLSINKVQ
jgi:hypothetical protein